MNHGIRTRLAGHQYLKRTGRANLAPNVIAVPTTYDEDCTRTLDRNVAVYLDVANVRQYQGVESGVSYIVWTCGRSFAVNRYTVAVQTADHRYESLV